MLVGLAHGRERGVAIGDLELDGQDGVAVLGNEVVERGSVARRGSHTVARREPGPRERTPKAARRARDEPDAISHTPLLPRRMRLSQSAAQWTDSASCARFGSFQPGRTKWHV